MSKKDEVKEGDELSEDEINMNTDTEDELEQTIPWPVKIITGGKNSHKGIGISEYINRNPFITSQNVNFEELTIDKDIIINGSQWRAALIYILPNVSAKCTNGGSLILVGKTGEDTEILGAHSQALIEAINGDIIL